MSLAPTTSLTKLMQHNCYIDYWMVQENAVSEGIVIGGVHDIRGISTLVSCPDPTSHKEKGLLTANEIVLHHLSV